jgi:nucleoside-diphosphate-sugar epimerase
MKTLQELEDIMTAPSKRLIEDIKKIDGDLLILGIGGKMGPSLAKMAKRAMNEPGVSHRIIGVSRFSSGSLREELEDFGIETIAADLLNEEDLKKIPEVPNIIYMAGTKFGTHGNEHYTWAMNAYLPGRVAERFSESNIVVFSTGNVYPLTPVFHGGSIEGDEAAAIGEYAQSCLGRERVFEYFSRKNGTKMLIFRLNYAIDMRYGVLLEIARSVYEEKTIDLRMGHVNVIWQGDANEYAIRSLLHCSSPPKILNVTGPETISVRRMAESFGKRLGKEPRFIYEESPTALLSNAGKCFKLFGYPHVSLNQMIDWVSEWVLNDGPTLSKPTHFQEREGVF